MLARDVIVIARRRAGLTQQQLGHRLGVPQVTIARWESGATEPKFRAVQETVQACELDLTLGLATADEGSWAPLIYEQSARQPADRVRHLTRDHFDRIAALKLIKTSGIRVIVVGETAGALHGWPLILGQHGTLDLVVHPADEKLAEDEIPRIETQRDRIRMIDAPPGTRGFADLARTSVSITIDDTTVEVATLVDLLRIALTERGPYSQRFALALDATRQFAERIPRPPMPVPVSPQHARERADQWLTRQIPA